MNNDFNTQTALDMQRGRLTALEALICRLLKNRPDIGAIFEDASRYVDGLEASMKKNKPQVPEESRLIQFETARSRLDDLRQKTTRLR